MLGEYMFLVMETKQNQDKENVLQAAMKKHLKVDEVISTEAKIRPSLPKCGASSPKLKKRHLSIESEELGEFDIENSMHNCFSVVPKIIKIKKLCL